MTWRGAERFGRLGMMLGLAGALVAASLWDAARVSASAEPGFFQKAGKKKTKPGKKAKAEEPKPETKPDTAPAGGTGGLSFSKDIAPILVANCVGCHGTGGNNRSQLNQSTFTGLMKGGKSGKAIEPGNPDESLLVQRVKGEGGPKMPPGGQRNLSEEAIGKLETWIRSGARLDAGINPEDPLSKYASTPEDLRRASLAKLSAAERDKLAEAAGLERWKKGDPKSTPTITPGTHFLLFGNLPKARASNTLKALENQYGTINRLLTTSAGAPLGGPEKISIYAFKDLNSYVEFVRGVENQDVEPGEAGRARLNVESPYVALHDPLAWGEEAATPKKATRSKKSGPDDAPSGPDRTFAGVVTEQLTIAAANRAGKPPRWVSLGLGAFLASRVEPRSPYYRKIRAEAGRQYQLGWQSKANEALGGEGAADATRAVGFAIFEWTAASDAQAVGTIACQMAEGGQGKLDDVIRDVLGGNRVQFLEGSGEWVQGQYGRLR